MTTYYCKCGRTVQKSTKAATTGNRDTESCIGCPYRMAYGTDRWNAETKTWEREAEGYECRMTDHPPRLTTHAGSPGGPRDKTVFHVESLDFDFLQTVTDWVRTTYPDGALTGGLQAWGVRASDYLDGIRVTFTPAQNLAGAAAKHALFDHFFHPDGTRLDMTPEEEKAKILADIEAGIHPAEKEEAMEPKTELTMRECADIIRHIPEGWAFHQLFLDIATRAETREDFERLIMEPDTRKELFDRDFLGDDKEGRTLSCGAHEEGLMVQAHSNKAGTAAATVPYPAVLEILWPVAHEMQQYAEAGLDPDDEEGTDISELGLSLSAVYCLDRAGIDTVEELAEMSDQEISCIRGLGKKAYDEIIEKLDAWVNGDDTDTNVGIIEADEEAPEAAMYLDNAGRLFRVGIWEEGSSGDRYGILVSDDDGNSWRHFKGSPVYGPEVDKPYQLAQLKLDRLAEASGWENGSVNPTPAAPASPADAGAAMAPAPSAAGTASLADGQASFDYSGLDIPTVDALHWAEGRIRDARSKYITDVAEAVGIAHDALCGVVRNSDDSNKNNGHRGEEAFVNWCRYAGISKSTAYQLLQVNSLLAGATPDEAAQLEQASPSLLYAAAKPSAPEELVQAVKEGDITTHKQYQEALARIRTLEAQNKSLLHSYETEKGKAEKNFLAAHDFHVRAEKAEAERSTLLDEQGQYIGDIEALKQQLEAAAARAEKAEKHEAFAADKLLKTQDELHKTAKERDEARRSVQLRQEEVDDAQNILDNQAMEIRQLKAQLASAGAQQPVTAVIDPEEVERRARELAASKADDGLTAMVSQTGETVRSILEALLRQLPEEVDGNLFGALDGLQDTLRELADSLDELLDDDY